ncbi:AAA family ATPase [Synechococcus sp. PCC 6312]|uniref:AAA family ATPase n=1 Tax=Synechococcus sp. (strain ATCC 27167 / PCC 6312) TaxID=195253 RepID=UPI00029ECF03|nr:AAA family ATPase [Synechococcus sp. PCC 6312]AFY60807.1 hypothetical protein Syn6312_1648 [Synechococcus sp. PCC 6312]
MTEKLIIKNFAGIKELEIEVKKINILIGPETSGKSICAKLLFYFKNFIWEILSAVEKGQEESRLNSDYSQKFVEYFPSDSWGKGDFHIRYEIFDMYIEIKRNSDNQSSLFLGYSGFFKTKINELFTSRKMLNDQIIDQTNKYEPNRLLELWEILRDVFIENLRNIKIPEVGYKQLFIPAGRSFFVNLQNKIFSVTSNSNVLDPFLRMFGLIYEGIKNSPHHLNHNHEEIINSDIQSEIRQVIKNSLRAKHIRRESEDYLVSSDGRQVRVANSSSGQQELLPLTIILEALPFLAYSSLGYAVYVEEPEAHLFPNTQRNIVELITAVFNSQSDKLQFFITTHSPYVLTAINNLLQAGQLYETADEDTQKKLEEILPKYKSLHTADVAAYSLSEGRCQNIINPETGLIDAQIIDSVSEELIVQFDSLLDFVEPINE